MITDINQLDFSRKYTYADYITWNFKERVELIKGWIHKMSPAPLDKHQQIAGQLFSEIGPFFKKSSCNARFSPYDVRLLDKRKSIADDDIYTVVQPDICVICDPSKIDRRGCIGAPDWVIEILSPGNSKMEMSNKFELYEENGVREYWIVQPEHENILVFALENDAFRLIKMYAGNDKVPSVTFPDLIIDLEDVF